MKRMIALALVAGSASIGFIAAPMAANATECTQNPSVHVVVNADINGTPVAVDQCIPG